VCQPRVLNFLRRTYYYYRQTAVYEFYNRIKGVPQFYNFSGICPVLGVVTGLCNHPLTRSRQ
jgi:hypothetical protein